MEALPFSTPVEGYSNNSPVGSSTEPAFRPASLSPARMTGGGGGGSNGETGGGAATNKIRTIDTYFTPAAGGGNGGFQRSASVTQGGEGTKGEAGGDVTTLRSRVTELERQLQEMQAESSRTLKEKVEQEQLSNVLREELLRAQEEGRKLKEVAVEKERRAGKTRRLFATDIHRNNK